MAEPKTVSNLPLDVSIRWAEDQKLLEESQPIIRESAFIQQHAQMDVTMPASQSQVEVLMGMMGCHPTWAQFQMPKGFATQFRRLFTSQLVSSLGSDEQQDTVIGRIQGASGEEGDQEAWQDEKRKLVHLLQLIQALNKDLIDILSRCKQYQKG